MLEWLEYITAQRDKKYKQIVCVLLNNSRGNPGRHWDGEHVERLKLLRKPDTSDQSSLG